MIAFIDGILQGKTAAVAYIDVHGIGFEVGMSQYSLAELPECGSRVRVYTYLQLRDDGMSLYGFTTQEEQALFERLIGVSGIGPKGALAALSAFAPEDLISAIMNQDVAAVQRIPGVGKKTAQRIILELKGSLDQKLASETSTAAIGSNLQVAREALLSMGFTPAETDLALTGAPEGANDSALLQYALKKLGA